MKIRTPSFRTATLSTFSALLLTSAALVSAPPQDSCKWPGSAAVPPVSGWMVYCESSPNSTGFVSDMYVTGSLSLSANDTWLHSTHCPPGEFGIFLFGENPAELTWGNGTLCISPFHPGVVRLGVPGIVPPSGESSLFLDVNSLPPEASILAGVEGYYQCLYRDPYVGEGFNLSNAVAITFGV